MQAEDTTGDFVKSADRTLDVLELLANWGRQLSHTDIAGALDIPKSSLTKLLKTWPLAITSNTCLRPRTTGLAMRF